MQVRVSIASVPFAGSQYRCREIGRDAQRWRSRQRWGQRRGRKACRPPAQTRLPGPAGYRREWRGNTMDQINIYKDTKL
jgi:hypothetical protein